MMPSCYDSVAFDLDREIRPRLLAVNHGLESLRRPPASGLGRRETGTQYPELSSIQSPPTFSKRPQRSRRSSFADSRLSCSICCSVHVADVIRGILQTVFIHPTIEVAGRSRFVAIIC